MMTLEPVQLVLSLLLSQDATKKLNKIAAAKPRSLESPATVLIG
jgi:hypothetical protein